MGFMADNIYLIQLNSIYPIYVNLISDSDDVTTLVSSYRVTADSTIPYVCYEINKLFDL